MITEKEHDDLEVYQIPGEYFTFLKESYENMQDGGFNEGFQHLCSRFSVAHDRFVKRENPEIFTLSRRRRYLHDSLQSIGNLLSQIHGKISSIPWELEKIEDKENK